MWTFETGTASGPLFTPWKVVQNAISLNNDIMHCAVKMLECWKSTVMFKTFLKPVRQWGGEKGHKLHHEYTGSWVHSSLKTNSAMCALTPAGDGEHCNPKENFPDTYICLCLFFPHIFSLPAPLKTVLVSHWTVRWDLVPFLNATLDQCSPSVRLKYHVPSFYSRYIKYH